MGYFFDTYALVEITQKNPNYVSYFDESITTSLLNLIELYYAVLRDSDEDKAKETYSKFRNSVIPLTDDAIFKAMKLKLKNKRLSYVDCIGYVLALENNLKFLTGGRQFEGMDNVVFVK